MQDEDLPETPLQRLRRSLSAGESTAGALAAQALAHANSNAGQNVYLALDPEQVLQDAAAPESELSSGGRPAKERPALYGIPVSIKDCFDLRGYRTTCGSRFYARQNPPAMQHSAVAAVLRRQGATIIGKTHLHQLAYGITGQNADYGDCVQPRNSRWLTGGSSSGAAASVQEGSAIAAIGTDTGGSIRVPAALCGLAGYRASHGMKLRALPGLNDDAWHGAAHLAASFDTVGWLYRDLRDGPAFAAALFDIEPRQIEAERERLLSGAPLSIGAVGPEFLHDSEPNVLHVLEGWKQQLARSGARIDLADTAFWHDALDIFAPIQAHEASVLHRGHYSEFQPGIAERLNWGASLSPGTLHTLHQRLARFRLQMDALFTRYDFLILPCAPMTTLDAASDHTATRARILRYTTPLSLGGNPVVALPGNSGGVQLAGRRGADARLLALSALLGERMPSEPQAGDVTLLP
ncbi:MAG TPA: amidase [Acidisarcina sp.]